MSARKLDALYAEYAAAKGNEREGAKEKLIRALYQDAYPIMYHRLGGYHPDIITDAVAMAAVHLDKFRGEARFSTWFYRIVANFCYRHLKDDLRRNEVSLEALIEEKGDEEIGGVEEARGEARVRLAEMLAVLAPDQRRIVEMKAEGKTDKQIGEVLGISAKAVNERLRRIRQLLSEKVNVGRESD